MTKFFKKNVFIIVLLAIVLGFAAISFVNVGDMSSASTFYQMGEVKAESSGYNAVCYSSDEVTSSSSTKSYESVWISFGSVDKSDKESVKIRLLFASGESSAFNELATKEINNDFESLNIGGWVCLSNKITLSALSNRSYVLLATQNEIMINEIAFVGKLNGKQSVLNMTAIGEGKKESVTASLSSSTEFGRSEDSVAAAYKLIDEQSKFDLSRTVTKENEDSTYTSYYISDTASLFTESEANTVLFMKNLFGEKGHYVDSSLNPLGACILGIGTAIFGYTTLGIRIMPLLFTLATIWLIYVFGNVLFGKKQYGLILAAIFAIGGYSLSFATYGSAVAVAAFFSLLSVYFAFKFYKKGISKINPVKSYAGILLSGLFYAVAVAVKTQALYVGIITLLFMIFGMLRQYAYYKEKKQAVAEEVAVGIKNEYLIKAKTTLLLIIMGIVIIPVLLITGSFLSAYKTMSVFYGTSNLLSMGAAHLTASFYNAATAFTAVNSYSPFGWIINYSAEKLSANKFIFGNIVITAVNLFSLVFCGYTIVKNIMALKKGEMTKEEKYLRFIPMTLVFVGFITVWLLNFIGAVGISGYYLPTIFGYILTVFAFIGMKEKFNKPALKIKGFTFSVVDVVSIALLFLSVITFALAVPAFIGVPASIGLFSFNVLSGKVFV